MSMSMSMSMSKHVSPRVPGSTSVSMKTYLDIVKECDKSVSFPHLLPSLSLPCPPHTRSLVVGMPSHNYIPSPNRAFRC